MIKPRYVRPPERERSDLERLMLKAGAIKTQELSMLISLIIYYYLLLFIILYSNFIYDTVFRVCFC